MKKSTCSLIMVLLIITTFGFTYIYSELQKEKASWYQSVSDRFYFVNFILYDGEKYAMEHITSLLISDIYSIGENKININEFDNTFQITYLCVGAKKSSKEQLINLFEQSEYAHKYDKEIFIIGLDKIYNHCKK